MQTFKQAEDFLKKKSTGESKLLVKQLHDDVLRLFPKLGSEKLLVENLNNQQIWNQLNRHLQTMTSSWGKYLRKCEKEIERQAEDAMIGEDEADDQQYEPNEEAQMENELVEDQEDAEAEQVGGEEVEADAQMAEQDDEVEQPEDIEIEGQEDVGLYGEQLDDEESDEENEGSDAANPLDAEEDNEFNKDEEVESDNLQAEQFQHFREVQQQDAANQGAEDKKIEQPTDEISKLEQKMFEKKDWRLKGEVQSKDRPLNSLIDTNLQFKRSTAPDQTNTEEQNSEIEKIIQQRILDQLYDDRVRYETIPGLKEHFTSLPEVPVEKNALSLGEIYEKDFKNLLGLKEDKTAKLKKEIMQQFKELSYKLECLSNFNFVPKPIIKEATITSEPYILNEEKIPITKAKDLQGVPKHVHRELKSLNEMTPKDRAAYRLKNKRIGRQRKKERDAKRMNRSIEFGGQTKFEAEARKKIAKNAKTGKKVKYSQSSQFFGALQANTAGSKSSKPNPNLNRMKM